MATSSLPAVRRNGVSADQNHRSASHQNARWPALEACAPIFDRDLTSVRDSGPQSGARYVVATGVLLAVLGCAWTLGLKLHSVFHQMEIDQTDRDALDAIVKGIVDTGPSARSDAEHQYPRASDAANLE